jgi:N-acetylglucosaminyl-diphospho-decaprenol L-rhamnosyltransferase
MPRPAVVLLNYNSGDDVIACLSSVCAQDPAEVVVIDNASSDGSDVRIAAMFPSANLIKNDTNRGFAAAANQGIRETTAEYVFLVNPDATVRPGSLDALASCLDAHPRAAAVGALVRNEDGSVQPTKRAFPTLGSAVLHGLVGIFWTNNPGTRAYLLMDADLTAARQVDWVACTATALRRDAFDAVGGFDERFFFFVEDVDLCKRLRDAGYEVWFEPGAEVVHRWGGSWTRRPLRFLLMHQANLFRYVRKHRRGAWVLLYPFIIAGLAARFVLLALRWLITKRSVPKHKAQAQGGSRD